MTDAATDIKIAFQGTFGAFSHRAAQMFLQELNPDCDISNRSLFVPCTTFEEIFDKVEKKEVNYSVVPLENSSIGSIIINYDLLASSSTYIISEIFVPVHHQLIGLAEAKVEEITEVYSHPAALGQCRKFLKSLPNAKAVEYWDTSGAVLHVSQTNNPKLAAIAGELAASEYGLTILQRDIEDYKQNSTRFGIIIACPPDNRMPSPPADLPYKLSCVVLLPHKPGSLALLLADLAQLNVNLTKIESRPIADTPWHYRFFLDVQVQNRTQEPAILQALSDHSKQCKLLGRYMS